MARLLSSKADHERDEADQSASQTNVARQAEAGQEPTNSPENSRPEATGLLNVQNMPPTIALPAQLYHSSTTLQDVSNFGPRPSRASSIMSTRTGVTISTLHDDARSARSIDVVLGSRVFHINRDGSSVLEQPGLPPYSPPPPEYSNSIRIPSPVDSALSEPGTPTGLPIEASLLYGGNSGGLVGAGQEPTDGDKTNLNTGLLMPGGGPSTPPMGISRNHSFTPGPETISVVQKRRSTSPSGILRNEHTQDNSNDNNNTTRDWLGLRRRNGIRPPKIFTAFSANKVLTSGNYVSPTSRMTRSAGPSLGGDDDSTPEPSPPTSESWIGSLAFDGTEAGASKKSALAKPQGRPTLEEGLAETDIPPSMESENDISIHYTRLIRSIDREHRRTLHQRDCDLAKMRERLNEVDQVYRQELKSRDFTIDDLRKRLETLEAQTEDRIEKAKNSVEDAWEARWKDRDRGLTERMEKMETDFQGEVDRAITQRDAEWAAALAKGETPKEKRTSLGSNYDLRVSSNKPWIGGSLGQK